MCNFQLPSARKPSRSLLMLALSVIRSPVNFIFLKVVKMRNRDQCGLNTCKTEQKGDLLFILCGHDNGNRTQIPDAGIRARQIRQSVTLIIRRLVEAENRKCVVPPTGLCGRRSEGKFNDYYGRRYLLKDASRLEGRMVDGTCRKILG